MPGLLINGNEHRVQGLDIINPNGINTRFGTGRPADIKKAGQ